MKYEATPGSAPLDGGVRPGSEAQSRWYDCGLSWALADSLASHGNEWTADDIARAFEAGANAGQAAERARWVADARRKLDAQIDAALRA